MNKFAEKLMSFAKSRNPQGCSVKEMASLLSGYETVLPSSYRQFMEMAGNGIDDFLRGTDFTMKELEGVREAADELLVEAGLPSLPSDAFVFSMHQGYQFYFFHDGGVYFFKEGSNKFEMRFDTFEEFFDSVVQKIERRQSP